MLLNCGVDNVRFVFDGMIGNMLSVVYMYQFDVVFMLLLFGRLLWLVLNVCVMMIGRMYCVLFGCLVQLQFYGDWNDGLLLIQRLFDDLLLFRLLEVGIVEYGVVIVNSLFSCVMVVCLLLIVLISVDQFCVKDQKQFGFVDLWNEFGMSVFSVLGVVLVGGVLCVVIILFGQLKMLCYYDVCVYSVLMLFVVMLIDGVFSMLVGSVCRNVVVEWLFSMCLMVVDDEWLLLFCDR